jgi:membrane associated rhomboid family serine protease
VTCADCQTGVTRYRPLVVPALIAVNTAIYALTAVQAGSAADNSRAGLFESWSLVTDQVARGEWWRLVTSGFLHFGPIHLAFNMIALWVIGKDLERLLGRPRFLAVYGVGLLGGSVAALCFSPPQAETAGASGAVFALMGGLTVVLRELNLSVRPALAMIAINLVISVTVPNISLAGHLGGLVTGLVLTALMIRHARRRPQPGGPR